MNSRNTLFSIIAACVIAAGVSYFVSKAVSNRRSPEQFSDTFSRIKKTGVLRVGYVTYPPTVIKDPNSGEVSGHFVDAIRFIGEVMNVKIEFHEAEFGTFAAGLQSGQFDVSIAATYRTIPRAMALAFTDPIIYIGNGAIVKQGERRFSSPGDFNQKGLVIAVAQGEASHEYARKHFTNAELKVLTTSNLSLPLAEVLAGRADVGLADAWTTSQFAKEHPEARDLFAGKPYDVTAVGWAVRPQDVELLQFLNTALDYCRSTGRMEEWEKKYNAHWVKPRSEFMVQ